MNIQDRISVWYHYSLITKHNGASFSGLRKDPQMGYYGPIGPLPVLAVVSIGRPGDAGIITLTGVTAVQIPRLLIIVTGLGEGLSSIGIAFVGREMNFTNEHS